MIVEFGIKSLRKLWHFFVTAFPGLARLAERTGRLGTVIVTNPAVAPIWNRVVSSPVGQALINIIQRFWWRDYSKERIDADRLSPEAHAVLRPVMCLAALLCILVPVAMLVPWPEVPADQVVEASGPVAAWSIVLWVLTLAVAWGSVLVGAGTSNRPVFLIVLVLYAYFLIYAAIAVLPPSMWNLPLPLVAMGALAYSEARLGRSGGGGLTVSVVTALGLGMALGYVFVGLFPGERVPIPMRLLVGAGVGLLMFAWGRYARRAPRWFPRPDHSESAAQNTFSALLFVFYVGLGIRGGFGVPATVTVEFLDVWSGYLWPVWYLLGTGLIFKLLTHTKVLTQSVRDVVPARWLVPGVIFVFLIGVLVTWSEFVLDTPGLHWPSPFVTLMATVFSLTLGFFWSEPLYAFSASLMRWVLLFDLVAATWLVIRRRLSAAAIMVLLGQTILLWFVITQYYLKLLSFNVAGSYSPLVMFLLALMMLWLLYRAGLYRAIGSSPLWPLTGRIGVYSAIMLVVLLEIHCRAAIHDALAIDRIFLYTFRGVVDFGLPYMLGIYASRRLKTLPLSTPHMIGAFGLGAVAALSLNALDKLVAAGGSLTRLAADLAERFDMEVTGQMDRLAHMVPDFPMSWTLTRGLLAMAALVAVAAIIRRKTRGQTHGPAMALFALIATGAGMGAFSQIRLDIPILSPRWAQLIMPYRTSMELDAHVIALFLSFTLPAMVLGLAFAAVGPGGTSRLRAITGITAATLLHLAAVVLWPDQEPWLRSSGMLWTCFAAAGGLFAVLLRAVRLRVEEVMPEELVESAMDQPMAGRRAVLAGAALGVTVLCVVAAYQIRAGRLVDREIDGLGSPLPVPAAWNRIEMPQSDVEAALTRSSVTFSRPILLVDLEEPEDGIEALLQKAIGEAQSTMPDFELYSGPESWQRHFDGAVALEFFYSQPQPDGSSVPMLGALALLPMRDGPVVGLGLLSSMSDFKARRWDLILVAETLQSRNEPADLTDRTRARESLDMSHAP